MKPFIPSVPSVLNFLSLDFLVLLILHSWL